ncbi:MAG: thioredoxin-disulfide reductase [Planctomycetes bacterium]|nr:thioredoxin-disulfide reductase [Planctomycetota bacterium]
MRDVVILGSGAAGLTAAIYTARANLNPLCLSGLMAGGLLTTTTEVENFPGFPEGIQGPELMENLRKQAARFGAEFLDGEDATAVDLSGRPLRVRAGEREIETRALIIATGASPRMLGLPAERELVGRGLSTCATCDGFFFRGKEIAVVGGGDSAMEEATFLTRFASKVSIIHRRGELRASKIMQEKAKANAKIAFVWHAVVDAYRKDGGGALRGLAIRDVRTGEISDLAVEGCFLAIGHDPNSAIVRGQLDLDDKGYIRTSGGSRTSIEGVFAAGDVQDHVYRQAVTAAGSGCMAAIDAERYLAALE